LAKNFPFSPLGVAETAEEPWRFRQLDFPIIGERPSYVSGGQGNSEDDDQQGQSWNTHVVDLLR